MRLSVIHITAFRGIGDVRLDLGELTLLIGENGCSKGAVIDAISLCLAPTSSDTPRFASADIPRRGGGLPEIRLTFVETKPDEFDAISGGIPERARVCDDQGRRTFTLGAHADVADAARDGGIPATVRFVAGMMRVEGDAAEAWRYVRRMCPALTIGRGDAPSPHAMHVRAPEAGERGGDDELDELIDLYRRMHETGEAIADEDVARVRTLFDRFMRRIEERAMPAPTPRGVSDLVEIIRPSAVWWQSGEGDAQLHAMGAATLIGMILTARGPRALAPDATPIVVAHCPEGWLHPILASRVWGTLRALSSQIVAVTYSGDLIARVPLRSLRRLDRAAGDLRVRSIGPDDLTLDQMRRVTYHIRLNRGAQLLARCWLLVEGETEAWLLPELAARAGCSLAAEGVACIEFAQIGLDAVIRLADIFGIRWHLLCDGDRAGAAYASVAARLLARRPKQRHITQLREHDVEHCFWRAGYASVFLDLARVRTARGRVPAAGEAIRKALKATGKPMAALYLVEAILAPDSPGVPERLLQAIEQSVELARVIEPSLA